MPALSLTGEPFPDHLVDSTGDISSYYDGIYLLLCVLLMEKDWVPGIDITYKCVDSMQVQWLG